MKRTLSKLQWLAIFGTSAGLAISSMGNFTGDDSNDTTTTLLMFGTLMTLGGTFFYCK
jgi:drug/metabolite transporter (DMT)-like permease